MTSKIWHKRALMLGLASLAALPLAAPRAGEARAATRFSGDLPTWVTSARDLPGDSGASDASFSAKAGRSVRDAKRGGRPAR